MIKVLFFLQIMIVEKVKKLLKIHVSLYYFIGPPLYRQIRIEGSAEKISAEESNAYFKTRPRGSQIGAHISPQSQMIPDRQFLENRFQDYETKFKNQEILDLRIGGFSDQATLFRILGRKIESFT